MEEVNDSLSDEGEQKSTAGSFPKSTKSTLSAILGVPSLDESHSILTDKENSSISETEDSVTVKKAPLLAVDTSAPSEGVPPESCTSQILSPSKKSVREVDELLSKTREWLVRHNETQSKKQTPCSMSDNDKTSLLPSTLSPLSERKVMGNIATWTEVVSVKHSSLSPASISIAASASTASASPTESPIGGPKKSIMEQLEEIRSKQRDLELRQKAKEQTTEA